MTGPELYRLDDTTLAAHLLELDEPELSDTLRLLQIEDDAAAARLEAPDALHNAARWYARTLGWPVFPLKPGQKIPATSSGFKDATVDLAQIDSWWTRNPACNIGLPTGHAFDVLDIDPPTGFLSLADWRDETPAVVTMLATALAVAYTGSGGRHYLLPPTGNGNGAGLRPGIDYRGAGGYIVAPPSKTSRRYVWLTPPKAGRS